MVASVVFMVKKVGVKAPPSSDEVRQRIFKSIMRSAPGMVRQLIDAAKEGNIQAAKFLFEIAGLSDVASKASGEEDSLAGVLLDRLSLIDTSNGAQANSGPGTESD